MKLFVSIILSINLLSGCSPKLLAAATGAAQALAKNKSGNSTNYNSTENDLEQCHVKALGARSRAINSNLIGYSTYQDPVLAYKYAMASCELKVIEARQGN